MLRRFAIAILKIKTKVLSYAYGFALPVHYRWSWLLRGRPLIIARRGSSISIGEKFTACSNPRFNSIGVIQRVFIRACTQGASIKVGDNVGMSGCTVSAHESVVIGNHVLIGSGALITDSDAHSLDMEERRLGISGESKPVVIEDDVFIGARAIVLKGVTIGKGAVIGAGAVVSVDVPPFSVVVGNPARVVRRLSRDALS